MNVRSLSSRLILWYTALIIALAVGFGGYVYDSLRSRLYDEMKMMLILRVEHMRDDILSRLAVYTPDALAKEIQDVYSPEENGRFIRISRADGVVLYVSGAPHDRGFDPAKVPLPRNYGIDFSEQDESLRSRQHLLLVGCVTKLAGHDYVIEMGTPTNAVDSALRKLVVALLIGLPFVVVVAVGGGFFLIRRALDPVERIRASAEKITYSNLRQRLPVSATGDAIEHLSVTLNQMLERLDQAYQQASRFSADAAHELRTPLTIMRSELESIGSDMHAWQMPLALRERVGSVLEEAERLSGIIEHLSAIARMDAGEAKMKHAPLDLTDMVRSTVEQMQLLADDKKISMTVQADVPVVITGDAARLKQVVVNLIDNAIKYTPEGGAVALKVYAASGKAFLTVRDNGIGIPPESLPHLFERFYRADKARSRTSQGAGLGLSIVRAICHAHGGAISIQSAEGAGTVATVELPPGDKETKGETKGDLHAAA